MQCLRERRNILFREFVRRQLCNQPADDGVLGYHSHHVFIGIEPRVPRINWQQNFFFFAEMDLALGAATLSAAFILWAMFSNRFFSSIVRIQAERGHAVVTGGPYRFVRHPGYVAFILQSPATALLLGSLWALVPAGLAGALLAVRTALEDRMLRAELAGYGEYAEAVRWRLVPGLW